MSRRAWALWAVPSGMHGALRVMEPALCAGRVSIICDDVVTTGATASEMVRVLQESGSRVLGVCAVAAVPKKLRRSVSCS